MTPHAFALMSLLLASSPPHAAVQTFDLKQVRLLPGPCLDGQEANRKYLHELDADRLLYVFDKNAGLPTKAQPVGGWEAPDCEVRGHFVGHYLSALALMYASTGDEALKDKAAYMVAEMAKCQQALGGGYLSAFPATFWDRLEKMENPPWAPYYTIHKIMAGLFDVYTICGNQQALDVLKGMAGYFKGRMDKLSPEQVQRILTVEFGGMAEVLHSLYGITHDPAHIALGHAFEKKAFLDPLALKHDDLAGIHANTHIPQVIGAARRYEVTGEERYRTITSFFWDCVVNHRSYATGGSNVGEGWGEPDKLANTLAANNEETCTTYNMLKVTRHLMQWNPDPKYADFYERAYFNGILGTQDPSNGMLIYYLPLATGNVKSFGTPYDAFWCCYGTGIENFSKLGDTIYLHDANDLYVNLYVASEVIWPEKGLRLVQRTRFPREEGSTFVFHAKAPIEMTLRLHMPYWATQGAQVKINGKPVEAKAAPTSYLPLHRTWSDGDRVAIRLPMSLHTAPMPDDPEMMALMYGPVVLAGLTDHSQLLIGDASKPDTWLKPVEGKPLTFRTVGQETDLTFIPLNRIVRERYGVYWVVTPEGSPRHKKHLADLQAAKEREARFIDRVVANDATSEGAHNLQGLNTGSGPYGGRGWRHATSDGWFGWDLKALPDKPLTLVCTYWGSDVPPRTFDVIVEGQTIATQSLNNNKPGEFFDVEYPIPPELTQGKSKITVRFKPKPGNLAGGVFECGVLK
jgi:DUF1680 family protein